MDLSQASSVAIILVNWNGYAFTLQCLRSLEKVLYPSFEVIVVDNASSDNSLDKLKAAFPRHHYIANPENSGFTGGNNLGMSFAMARGFDFILLLNNDTEVEADFLEKMVSFHRAHPDAGMVQPLICFNHDRGLIWSAGGGYSGAFGISRTYHDRKKLSGTEMKDRELDWATGCCILISRETLFETGMLTPGYFAYFEDVDWSLRLRNKGFKIYLASQSIIYHEAGASSKKQHKEGTLSPTVFYLHTRNQLFLIRNHVGFPLNLLAFGFHLLKYVGWISYFCLRRRFTKARSVMRGIRDGFALDPKSMIPLCP